MIPQQLPTRPVVFLDIDGVLNSPKNYRTWAQKTREGDHARDPQSVIAEVQSGRPEADRNAIWLFDPDMVERLNHITDTGNADIVVSSSWRLFYGEARFPELAQLMRDAGITGPILGMTPSRWYQRGEAIRQWLYSERPGGSRLVILDDEYPSEFPGLRPWLQQTSSTVGIQEGDVTEALQKLTAAPFFPKP